MSDHDDDQPIAEPLARGLLTGWLLSKTLPGLIRLAMWGGRLAVLAAYGAVVWRRARKALLAGALDDEGDPAFAAAPSVVVRERGLVGWIRGPQP
jgi:hypothetical protein